MQFHQDAGRLDGRRHASAILARQRFEAELLFPAAFPEEIGVYPGRHRLCVGQQIRGTRLREAQQYSACLDLAAPAVRRLDLQRGVVIGEHRPDLEGAAFLVEYVRRGHATDTPG